jgi:CRP-like cAMP-binding protein
MNELLENYLDILEKVVLFKKIDRIDLMETLKCLQPRISHYKKDEMVVNTGDPLTEMGIILSGELDVLKETSTGEKVIIGKLKAKSIFGEIAVLAQSNYAPAQVTTTAPSTVLFISPTTILGTCSKHCIGHEKLIRNTVQLVAKKALNLNQKIDILVVKSMRGRICTYLARLYKQNDNFILIIPFNRNGLAEFLNVSRPSLSRELGRMEDEGLIHLEGNTIEILDIDEILKWL